jgi:beta-lactamase regulating signal transducer with metallopeptidase domain
VMQLHAMAAAVSWVLGDNHDSFPAAFAQFARAVSPAALDAMWQGAAVALGLVLFLRFVPRVSAAHRFAAWTAGLAVVAALPFLPFIAHVVSGPGLVAGLSSTGAAPKPRFQFDDRWALVIAALWLAASALRVVQLGRHSLRLRRLWKTATPIADDTLLALVPAGRRVAICTTNVLDRPSVIGFFAPRILIPEWLYARLTPQELSQVVLHEAEHLRRHDDWTNLIQKFALVLFPLNPALAWIERRLCREREMACDEGVVRRTQAPRAYAACLANLAERGMQREIERRAEALSLAAWRRRPELVHRVHGILWSKPALNPVAARVLLSALGCGLLAASVVLARSPQMVAFVAAPKLQETAQADAVNVDRASYKPALASSASGLHVVETKAILTSRFPRAAQAVIAASPVNRASALPPAAPANEIASRDAQPGTPHETLLKAEMPPSKVEQAARQNAAAEQSASQAEYVVFTAYERVETVPQNSREVADYDTGASMNSQSGNQKAVDPQVGTNTNPVPAARVSVTRLIFKVDPASRMKGSSNKSTTDSQSVHLPAIVPFGNGWLVFQL